VSLIRRVKLINLVHDVMYCIVYRNLNTNTASHRPNTSTGTSRNPYTNTASLIDED